MPSDRPRGLGATAGSERPAGDRAPGLATALRDGTQALHRRAERSGIIRDVITGRASRYGYALLLRNLLPAYRAMEGGLERRRQTTAIGRFAIPALYRAEALEHDIRQIQGPDWQRELPLLTAGILYADRISAVAAKSPPRLIGHAYVRYLGDLSGGQILSTLLSRSLGLGADSLRFYDFPAIPDIPQFKAELKDAIDHSASGTADAGEIVAEAENAFILNIAISEAVGSAAADPSVAASVQTAAMS